MEPAAHSVTKLDSISIDRDSSVPLYQQLENAIQKALASGSFSTDERLPAIQELAVQLQVSRNTVRRAFQNLTARGLLAGTAVSGFRARGSGGEQKSENPTSLGRTVAFDRGSALDQIDLERLQTGAAPRPFLPGFPETKEFPLELWERLRALVLKERAPELLQHCDAFGYLPLREAIANRLYRVRGVKCTPEQVIISAGTQQALYLAIHALVSPGEAVGMEEPGYYGAKAAFLHAGARVLPMLVDEEGLMVPEARRQNPPVMIYMTPGNQFPLGVKLSFVRRAALLEFARDTGTWLVEDDSDSDFSYSGQPPPSLQSADEIGRVIYLGSTGRTLFPSLEIGYLVVPLSSLNSFSKTKELLGAQPCAIDQATLAQFISHGHMDEHVQRMNALYYRRLQALAESVDSELDEFIDLEPAEGGLHAVGWLKRGLDEQAVANCAETAGVELPLLSKFGHTALMRPGVVFGFAAFSEKQIRRAVRRLRSALRSKKAASGLTQTGLLSRLLRRA